MNLNTNLNNQPFGVTPVTNYPSLFPLNEGTSSAFALNHSSMEKSESVALLNLMNGAETPVLFPPNSKDNVLALAVAAITGSGKSLNEFFIAMSQKQSEIIDQAAEGWQKNLKEIATQIQHMLTSPQYLVLQEISQHGDQSQSNVAGLQSASSANHASNDLAHSVDYLQVLKKIPSAQTIEPSNVSQKTDSLIIPLTAVVMAAGALSIVSGIDAASSLGGLNTSPFSNGVEMVSKLQQLVPQVSVSDMIPMINLMVMAPIYFRSLEETMSNFKNNESQNYTAVAQNYAKDVIKMVADPTFISQTIIGSSESTTSLETDDQNRLTRILKLILIGTALSLLYSVDVGKIQNNQFGGIEPEELKDLLLGKLNDIPSRLGSIQNNLYQTLGRQAKEALAMLELKDRAYAVEVLFEYLGSSRDLNHLLDPAKVFHETLKASQYEHPLDQVVV